MGSIMKTKNSAIVKTLLAVAVFTLTTTSYASEVLRLASGVPPLHPAHNPLYTEFQKLLPLSTEGAVKAEIMGTEITTVSNMRASITSGLVEIGLFLPSYFPADLPNFNLIGDLPMEGASPQATTAAATEYISTCNDCLSEFDNLGVVYTTTHSTDTYRLLTKKAVRNPDDMIGMRIRVATPQHARWVESMGAKSVRLPAGEVFEAFSQGVIDGSVASISDLISFNLREVVTHVTLLDLGTFHSTSNHTIKKSVWHELSKEQREAVIKSSYKSSILTTKRWEELKEMSIKIANENNIEILEPSKTLIERTNSFKENDLSYVYSDALNKFEINDAENKISRFKNLLDKWEALISEGDNSAEHILALYEKEIFHKMNLDEYSK
jgi:TRAP-type C4-dicarboxylate transport system substrate-binding protein